MRALLFGIVLFAAAQLAASAQAFTYAGDGIDSCGSWTHDRQEPGGGVAQQWVLGFLAGAALEGGPDPLSRTDADGVWAWVDRYCWNNPTDDLMKAMESFVATWR